MSDTDPDQPRRAADDADERPDPARDDGSAPRSWVPTQESGTDAGAGDVEVSTPIPPPAPTLPEPAQPVSAGRRFSAEDLPEDWRSAAPRRSAVSVSSPPFPPAEAFGTASERLRHSDDTEPEPAAAGSGEPDAVSEVFLAPEAAAAAPDPRRRALAWVAGIAAVAVVIGLIAWSVAARPSPTAAVPAAVETASPTPSASETPPPALVDTQLIAASEVAKRGKGLTWTQQDATATTAAPLQPVCLELSSTGGASPDTELSRLLTASKNGGSLLQVIQSWPSAEAATAAREALIAQAGACESGLLLSADRVTGLADSADALTLRTADGVTHTLLVVRTGRFLSILDAAAVKADPFSAAALATAAVPSQRRQCGPAAGACPGSVKAVATTPPPTETQGWLAWVDLSLPTVGSGKWTATDPLAPKLVGSQCEDLDLNKLSGTSAALHRTYLLTDDPKAPEGFGIDEAIYTFPKESSAAALAKQLDQNFAGCGKRTRTASVKESTVTAAAASGKSLTATSYLVTQRISDSKTVAFRVGLAVVGNRMVYLLANPSASFDFSEDAWRAIVGRATQRVTQLG